MNGEANCLAALIEEKRGAGRVICSWINKPMSLSALAERAGLNPSSENYRGCSEEEAKWIGCRVIACSLADDDPLVPEATANEIVDSFLSQSGSAATQYYTNGEFRFIGGTSYLSRWRKVTPEKMSCGILVFCKSSCGVLWIADQFQSAEKPG